VYGGGILLAVGAYSYSGNNGISSVSGSTTVSDTNYTFSSNMLDNCSATSSSSGGCSGANVYGGGLSVAVGAYVCSYNSGNDGGSSVSGSTTVTNTNYTISSNMLTSCSATSSFGGMSIGTNVYGGGISMAVGVYFYSSGGGGSSVSGNATVSNTKYTISSNMLTSCIATSSWFSVSSFGVNVYGGGISMAVGAYISIWNYELNSPTVSTTVSNTIYTISSIMLINCSATSSSSGSSYGANAYGGGISVAVGAYSWTELVVAAYSSLGLCICVSADGGMPPTSACSHSVMKQVDWGANRHPQNKDARHNKQSSGCSAEDLAAIRCRQLAGVFKLPVKHVPYFINFVKLQNLVPSSPLRKPAGTLQSRGKPKFKIR
jgi:hypothetical protein